MAVTVERLIATLEAKIDKYEKNLQKAYGQTDRQFSRIERRGKTMESRLSKIGAGGFLSSLSKGLAVAGGIRGLQSLLDSTTRIDNALKVAGLSGDDLEKVYDRLRESAVRNAAPLETLVSLYSRAQMAASNLGASQEDLLKFSDNVALSLRVSGQSATEAAGALLQLSQLLSGSVVQAQEYKSLIDGAYPLLQAVAKGLKEAGGDVGKLTGLVKAGKVPTRAFFEAFQAGSYILEEKVAGATLTTSQALENVRTAAIDAMRDFSRGSSGADTLASAIQSLAGVVNSVNFTKFGQEVKQLADWIGEVKGSLDWLHNAGANFGSATGLDRVGEFLTGGDVQRKFGPITVTSTRALQSRIDGAFEQTVQSAGDLTVDALKNWATRNGLSSPSAGGKTDRLPSSTPPSPVSLADFSVPGTKKKKGRGGHRATADDRFAEDVQSIKDRTAALREEQATLGMSFFEQQKRAVSLDLEQEALRQVREEARRKGDQDWQNAQLSPDQVKQIDEVSDAYARQADSLRKAQEAQDLRRDVLKGAFSDLRSALDDGKLDWNDLANVAVNALDKIIDKVENDLVDAILQANSAGGSGGGIFGSLLSLFGGGSSFGTASGFADMLGIGTRAGGGPVRAGQPYIVGEKRPELFVPGTNGTILPSLPTVAAAGGSQSSAYSDNRVYNIDARGAQEGVDTKIVQAIQAYDRHMPDRVKQIQADPRLR